MKKEIKIIRDIKSIQLCVEETRSKILSLLRVKDMSIPQLAQALDKDQSTIFRHIKKLEEIGFVEVCGERKQYHIPQKKYTRTAQIFLLTMSGDDSRGGDLRKEWQITEAKKVVDIINALDEVKKEDAAVIAEKLADIFSSLDEKSDDFIEKKQELIRDISYPTLLRLKLLLFLYQIKTNDIMDEKLEEILNQLDISFEDLEYT